MPNPDTYSIYQAYSINVRDFLIAEKEVKRGINRALKSKKSTTVEVQTKLYALLYSTYAESSFMKMILTPFGLEQDYLRQILEEGSVQEKWIKCLELAFLKFTSFSKGSDVPNKTLKLRRIILEYIVDPSILRNKIAHGQLTVALNRSNNNLNLEATTKLQQLDFVHIQRLFEINKRLCGIIEDIIESPDGAHKDYYHSKIQNLEAFIEKSSNWTTDTKLQTNSMRKMIPDRD